MNIVLIGYRCSGKTTVGKIIARDLMRNFIDTDLLIEERTCLSIQSYVLKKGWEPFRQLEREIVKELASEEHLVIATGGGVVTFADNVRNLKRNGWLVWLKADPSVIRERMKREQKRGKFRPSLSETDSLEEIDGILRERNSFYEGASDHTVDTNGHGPEEVARAIIKTLPQELTSVG